MQRKAKRGGLLVPRLQVYTIKACTFLHYIFYNVLLNCNEHKI